jgi:hypothetical protein
VISDVALCLGHVKQCRPERLDQAAHRTRWKSIIDFSSLRIGDRNGVGAAGCTFGDKEISGSK